MKEKLALSKRNLLFQLEPVFFLRLSRYTKAAGEDDNAADDDTDDDFPDPPPHRRQGGAGRRKLDDPGFQKAFQSTTWFRFKV